MKLTIQALTPLTIKSGEELESYQYHLDPEARIVYMIDYPALLAGMNPDTRKTFEGVAAAGPEKLRCFIADVWDSKSCTGSILVSQAFVEYHLKMQDDPRAELTINLHCRSGDGPIIPGSSVKGATRTAVLFGLFNPDQRYNECTFEAQVLGYERFDERTRRTRQELERDPFRALKISDSLEHPQTCVFRLEVLGSKSGYEPTGIIESTECILPMQTTTHHLSLDEKVYRRMKTFSKENELSLDKIVTALRTFAEAQLNAQSRFFKDKPGAKHDTDNLLKHLHQCAPNQSLIRLGFGTGREGISVALKRGDPTPRSRKTVEKQTLLGWARISFGG